MKYFKLDLLTLLISLFIFSSCQNSDTIGLDIEPGDSIISRLVDTVKIDARTVREDSVQTNGLSQHPFGLFRDPDLGSTTQANLAMALDLPSSSYSFGEVFQLDSVVLVLDYGDEFYGDSLNSTYNIKVHQLTEKLSGSVRQYNNKSWRHNPNVIGSKSVTRFAWNDSIAVTQIVTGAADTAKKLPAHLRIPITDTDLIFEKIIHAGSGNLSSNSAFQNFFNGLYLTAEVPNSATGGIIFFNTATAGASKLEIYYKKQNSGATDTVLASFPITSSNTVAEIKNNYSGSIIENQLNKSAETVYVQPMGGLRTSIRFPYLHKLKERGRFAVNKAELVVNVAEGTQTPFAPAKRLVIYRTDIAGQRQLLPDISSSIIGAVYDKNKSRYIFNITSYVQGLLNDETQQYGLFISAIDYNASTSEPNIFPQATTAMRSILGGTEPSSKKMKLNIYYTKPD